jgi:hypothetical protein
MSAETSTTPTTEAPVKKISPWLAHIAAFRASNPDVSYKQALVQAKESYTSANPNSKPRAPRTAAALTKTKIRKLKVKIAALEATLAIVVADA